MGFIKFKDCKSVEEYFNRQQETVCNICGTDFTKTRTIVYKSDTAFGAITTMEVYGEGIFEVSDLLAAAYDNPEKIKKLFSLGDLYFLGTAIPDEQYIRDIERTLKDGYAVIDRYELISRIETTPDEHYNIEKKLTILWEKFYGDGMTLSKVTLNRLLGKAVKPKVHTSHNLKELYKGEMCLFDNKSGCWYEERDGHQLFDQNGNLITQSLRKVEKGSYSLNIIIKDRTEFNLEDLLESRGSISWIKVPKDNNEIRDSLNYHKDDPKQAKTILDMFGYYRKYIDNKHNLGAKKEQPQNITPRMVVMQLNKEFAQANSVYRVGYSEEHSGNKTRIVFKVWDNIERRGKPGMVCLDPLDIISRIYIGEKTRAVELVCAYHNQYSH